MKTLSHYISNYISLSIFSTNDVITDSKEDPLSDLMKIETGGCSKRNALLKVCLLAFFNHIFRLLDDIYCQSILLILKLIKVILFSFEVVSKQNSRIPEH